VLRWWGVLAERAVGREGPKGRRMAAAGTGGGRKRGTEPLWCAPGQAAWGKLGIASEWDGPCLLLWGLVRPTTRSPRRPWKRRKLWLKSCVDQLHEDNGKGAGWYDNVCLRVLPHSSTPAILSKTRLRMRLWTKRIRFTRAARPRSYKDFDTVLPVKPPSGGTGPRSTPLDCSLCVGPAFNRGAHLR
jgi:hypothetical protein